MPKIAKPLSALEIKRLHKPGRYPVGTVAGLQFDVQVSGSRQWVLRTVVGGKRRDLGLGGYPEVSLADALERARILKGQVREGIDPTRQRQEQRSALHRAQQRAVTFDTAVRRFLEAKSDEFTNSKHRAQWSSTLRTYASPVIGKKIVSDITSDDVYDVLAPLWKTKTETATRVRGRIEKVLSYAMQCGWIDKGLNPAAWKNNLDLRLAAPTKITPVEHFPALPYAELSRFMAALRAVEGYGARALEFCVLTASRSGTVRLATWDEIDLEAKVWICPAKHMKMKVEHRVPLSTSAVCLLESLPRVAGTDLIFPSAKNSPLSDMTLTATIRRLNDADIKAGGPGFTDPKLESRIVTVHGFRSTFKDWASEETDHAPQVVEMALAHTVGARVEAAYRRGDLFEKRKTLMDSWASFCI